MLHEALTVIAYAHADLMLALPYGQTNKASLRMFHYIGNGLLNNKKQLVLDGIGDAAIQFQLFHSL
ncbi:hypothetical protein D3C76_1825910 [compost metagenome]